MNEKNFVDMSANANIKVAPDVDSSVMIKICASCRQNKFILLMEKKNEWLTIYAQCCNCNRKIEIGNAKQKTG